MATYLVTLSGLILSNEAANKIVELYERLDVFDKKETKYTQRHQTKQLQGRFKSSKGASRLISVVEATKRYIGFTLSYIIIYYKTKIQCLVNLFLCINETSVFRKKNEKMSSVDWKSNTFTVYLFHDSKAV